jgi:hypothetical protein
MKRGAMKRPEVLTQMVVCVLNCLTKVPALEVSGAFRMTAIAVNFNRIASAFA